MIFWYLKIVDSALIQPVALSRKKSECGGRNDFIWSFYLHIQEESKAFQRLPQTSTIKSFRTTGNGFQWLSIVAKHRILDACGRRGHAFHCTKNEVFH